MDQTAAALRRIYGSSDPEYAASWRNWAKYVASGFPVIGGVIRQLDNWNYINDYMTNRGLSWSDVKYPSRISGSGSFGSTLNFVSSNIGRLYK